MNVTRSSFCQTLPFILDCIKRCDYIAFDFEFTGIKASDSLINSALEPVKKISFNHIKKYWDF